jgi:hypothetical protein
VKSFKHLRESQEKIRKINNFVSFACEHLGLELPPEIHYVDDKSHAFENRSFGSYHIGQNKINVNIAERHVADIIRTLAHEMVHIRQFAYGETNSSLDVWRGIPIDSAKLDYYLHPWELDAYGMETGLFTKYVVSEKLWDVFEGLVDPDSPITEYPIKWKTVEIIK